jgi:hypothetical protein
MGIHMLHVSDTEVVKGFMGAPALFVLCRVCVVS